MSKGKKAKSETLKPKYIPKRSTRALGPKGGKSDIKERFLKALAEEKVIYKACKVVSVARKTCLRWREQDEEFRDAWDEIFEQTTDQLEAASLKRAIHGTLKPVFHKDEVVGHVREHNATREIFHLKSRRPGVYNTQPGADDSVSVQQRAAQLRAFIDAANSTVTDGDS